MDKSIVLLSGGLDSTVNLYEAHLKSEIVQVLTFDYGQRAARKEIPRATELSRGLGLSHQVIEIPWMKNLGPSSLINANTKIPESMDINDLKACQESAKSVWVPNRNGVFLNIGAAFAEAMEASLLVPGFNIEEAQTFPDNSQAYLESMNHCLSFSTSNRVKVKCFTTEMNKTQIYSRGLELKVPFSLIWPCYFGADSICGLCESCLRFERARRDNCSNKG